MLKVFCNVCDQEINVSGCFLLEATITELLPVFTGDDLNTKKQTQKKVFHICNKCYDKNIKKLIYGKL